MVILTSGTTGTPKGAKRKQPDSLEPAAALFSKIPLKARETTVIAAPMFHSWGYAHFTLALPLASTLVLRRRFDPEQTLADRGTPPRERARGRAGDAAADHGAAAGDDRALRPELRCGSSRRRARCCPASSPTRAMDAFGEVLYNLYGSTEVAWATIATPEDLRAAPGTAGRPPLGTVVKLLDAEGREVPRGRAGADLRRERDGLRGLHRRRRQGDRARA